MATVTSGKPAPAAPPVINLPNLLTFARLVLAVVIFVLIPLEAWLWCVVVYALAAITDILDGPIARAWGLASALGRNLDPIVDKVLVCGTYVFVLPLGYQEGWLAPWMVTIVVARELIITSLRSFMENQGAKFGADRLGKIKMVLQSAALIAIFVELYIRPPAGEPVPEWRRWVCDGLIYSMLIATALSGMQYLWRASAMLKKDG